MGLLPYFKKCSPESGGVETIVAHAEIVPHGLLFSVLRKTKLPLSRCEMTLVRVYRVTQKKTGDFSRQPQIVSGRIIYQNVGNFLEIMCAKFGGIRCYRRLAVPEKLPKIGPKSRFT